MSPVQTRHRPLLVPAKLVHRDDFLLQDLQQVIIQVELDLERPIGDTATTPQHLQCLLQDFVKGHDLPFPCLGFLAMHAIMHQDSIIGTAKDIPMTTHAVTLQLPEHVYLRLQRVPRRPSNRLMTLCSVPFRSVLPPVGKMPRPNFRRTSLHSIAWTIPPCGTLRAVARPQRIWCGARNFWKERQRHPL